MILINEVVHPGEVHLEINTALLKIFYLQNNKSNIAFRAEATHCRAVKKKMDEDSKFISFLDFQTYYNPKSYSWAKRIKGEIIEIYRSLKIGRKLGADIYIWNCLFPTGHLFLNLLLIFKRTKKKHVIVLHGELEYLKAKKSNRFRFVLGKILKIALNISKKNVEYIVLGDRIKENLFAYVNNDLADSLVSIVHPYNYKSNHAVANTIKTINSPVTFGAVGTQMLIKNSQNIFHLASKIKNQIQTRQINLVTIGMVLPEIEPYDNKLVNHIYPHSFVPTNIFDEQLEKLDFALFFYDNEAYKLCASGAIFEMINANIPIISIHNDYFDWLFSLYGYMGFLCRDLNEMEAVVLSILKGQRNNEIDNIHRNISNFKINNSIEAIASRFVIK
ncbi:hypothetical protein [Mucilaginibacter sp. HD30]